MPFYKTITFFICLIAIVILAILFWFVGRRAMAQSPGEKRRPLVELALDDSKQDRLRTALKWDFAFIPIYTLTTSLICFLVASLTGASLELTRIIIVLVVVGALIDVCENLTLFHVIKTSKRDAWARVARSLEVLKFVSPAIATIYALTVGIRGVINVFTT
ncbi:MAG TPA: hypothetical protein VFZ22_07035 [Pyrinomonadaceae bacterium]|nr:hypothetical protein [Pyrinomonadaceae bacterium]